MDWGEEEDTARVRSREHAERIHCPCADDRPRWHPCGYHEGFIDGYDRRELDERNR